MKNGFMRYFIAVMLIGFGTMLVLDNLGVLKTDFKSAWHVIYPIFFVIMGFRLLFKYFKYGGSGWIMGSFLVIFGSLLLLGQFEVIDYRFKDIFKLWPLLIVYFGFSIVGKSRYHRSRVQISKNDFGYQKDRYSNWQRFSVGNYEYKSPNWKVEPMNLTKAAGNFYLDFTKAFIPQEDIPISIQSWAGDVQILLPENIEFSIEAVVRAGEINVLDETVDGVNRDLAYKTIGYDEAEQKLTFSVDLKAGSVRVDRV